MQPCHTENTSSCLISEVKQFRAGLVPWSVPFSFTLNFVCFDNAYVYSHTKLKAAVLIWSLKLAVSGRVSTLMGDHLGIPYVLDFHFLNFIGCYFTVDFVCFGKARHTTQEAPILIWSKQCWVGLVTWWVTTWKSVL